MADDGWGWLRKEAGLMGDTVSDRTMERVRAYAALEMAAQKAASIPDQEFGTSREYVKEERASAAQQRVEEAERHAFALRHTALELTIRLAGPTRLEPHMGNVSHVIAAANSIMTFLKGEKQPERFPGATKEDPLGLRVHGVAAAGFDQKNW